VNDLAPKLTGELRGIRVCNWGASRAREQKLRDANCVKALIGPGELTIVAIVLGSRGVQETESSARSGFGGGLSSSAALSPTRRRYIRCLRAENNLSLMQGDEGGQTAPCCMK